MIFCRGYFLFARKILWNFLANKRHYVSIMRSNSVRYSTKLERTSLSGICVAEKKFIASQNRSRAEIARSAIFFTRKLVRESEETIKEYKLNYNYEEVIEKIENARRFGNLPGVEVTAKALKHPMFADWNIPYIHVAGTNGKGSTCAFLDSIFQKAGIKTGLFTSPHLICFEERIRVNGAYIPKEDVTRLGNLLLNSDFGVSLTMFDYCLLMAVLYFAEQKVELAIMETGLGGRLDSTNALGTPVAAVLTKIGFDHTDILGDSLEKIAAEKAGIIKEGSLVISQIQEAEVAEVFREKAKENKAKELIFVAPEDIEQVRSFKPHMQGEYQYENGAAAMVCAKAVAELISEIPAQVASEELTSEVPVQDALEALQAAIPEGIRTASWAGRMEVLSEDPFFLVDGAHNGHGVHAFCKSLKELYPNEKFHFCMGVMADKDYLIMIKELLPIAIDFVTVTPESNRALQAEELAAQIREAGVKARCLTEEEMNLQVQGLTEEEKNGLERPRLSACFSNLDREHKTVAFGSLYFIGELKAAWLEEHR